MDSATNTIKAVAKLTEVIEVDEQSLNRPEILKGLGIKHIDEIRAKLHSFARGSQSNTARGFLWQFELYAFVDPSVRIGAKYPEKLSSYSNVWRCKNKLVIRDVEPIHSLHIFYCFARLVPVSKSAELVTMDVCTSPFEIGRRSNIDEEPMWPCSIRGAISSKHAVIHHDFSKNTTEIQVHFPLYSDFVSLHFL